MPVMPTAAVTDERSEYQHHRALAGLDSQREADGSTLHGQMVATPTTYWQRSVGLGCQGAERNDQVHQATPTSYTDGERRDDSAGDLIVSALMPLAQLIESQTSAAMSAEATEPQGPRKHTPLSPRQPTGTLTTEELASPTSEGHFGPSGKRVRVKTERRREQCRANQARYRNKQRALRLELEGSVAELRKEVGELEAKRRSLFRKVNAKLTPWCVVVEYFRLFRYGSSISSSASQKKSTNGSVDATATGSTSSVFATTTDSPSGQAQLELLRSVMAPDVHLVGSDVHGVDALVAQWARWSQCFDCFELHLDRVEKASGLGDTLVATSRMRVTISDSTVRYVFPHLIAQRSAETRDERSGSELAWQLCGQQLEFKGVLWFTCDQRTSQVLRLRCQLDLVPTMRRVLGSLRDVARVLDGARLTSDGLLLH